MSDDFSTEDIAAMRREGDLSSFLREQLRAGRAQRAQPSVPAPRRPTGRPPGAWPTGIAPATPPTVQYPASAWTAALDDYRRWLITADHPEREDPNQTCGCPSCQALA
ncbi:hypothetical protein GCM10010275_19400 [Streptomyces litmocidini]|uniref:hypothetical protein n=1 Tax=Streptomyces litmocidini TaxID=67318 RepID=UPI00167EE4A1|nr:hypothetical protein [Streptomyces litmocidini]GGU84463.1 hypothetical protein GCM10010275_19400 [Streptomyces litmocidini]